MNDEIMECILNAYEQGLEVADIYDLLDERVQWEDLEEIIKDYEDSLRPDYFYKEAN